MLGTNDDVFMARYSAFNPYRLRHRDMGFQAPIGSGDAIAKSLYCGMKPISCWSSDDPNTPTGGIFNLEFSPEGSLLVAACEKRTIQLFDPGNQTKIHSIVNAHMDCINCVKFLDSRMFATCSDDTTIALWDVRNLSKKIRSLVGHSKWVKNIEFSQKDKLLVTSGLDGSIYTWDINSYTEFNLVYERVFHTTSLMRCRLSPDSRQMVLSTTGGLIVLIHDLNLATLCRDLMGFKPNLYRLMQMSQQVIPIASRYDYLFDPHRKENRVEFISDFPQGNDAEVVSSLQIHPHGWTALSRNISHEDKSEWTCIHDIQPAALPSDKSTRDRSPSPPAAPRRSARLSRTAAPRRLTHTLRRSPRFTSRVEVASQRRSPRVTGTINPERDERTRAREREREPVAGPSNNEDAELVPTPPVDIRNQAEGNPESATPRLDRVLNIGGNPPVDAIADAAASGLGRGIQNDLWEASITIKQHRLLQEIFRRGSVRRSFNMQRITGINTGITPPPLRALAAHRPPSDYSPNVIECERPSLSGMTPEQMSVNESEREAAAPQEGQITQNKDRLLYYIEETNQGKGFIKELCYSADGRVVCSPFGKGIRLLALDENCSEIPSVIQEFEGPTEMREIGQSLGHHNDLVVCSKFNPRFHMLVSGCLDGKVVWYQPYSGETLF